MFSPTTIYVIRGVALLGRLAPNEYNGAVAVASEVGAPAQYLAKLFQILSRDGLLVSQKGLGGGFRLGRSPDDITLFDIVEPIEHASRYQGCLMGQDECSCDSPCVFHARWSRVRAAYLEMLQETTLTTLIAHGNTQKRQEADYATHNDADG